MLCRLLGFWVVPGSVPVNLAINYNVIITGHSFPRTGSVGFAFSKIFFFNALRRKVMILLWRYHSVKLWKAEVKHKPDFTGVFSHSREGPCYYLLFYFTQMWIGFATNFATTKQVFKPFGLWLRGRKYHFVEKSQIWASYSVYAGFFDPPEMNRRGGCSNV